MGTRGTTDVSPTGGRARSVTSFSSATEIAATAAARLAARAQTRDGQRRLASPTAPKAAMRGHLTHQADAITKRIVSGSQRIA
jgi:hypothetical protein